MMLALVAALLTQSPATCRTACGMSAPFVNARACHELWTLEREELESLAPIYLTTPQVACTALRGWTITVHEYTRVDVLCNSALTHADPSFDPSFNLGWFCAFGYTDVDLRTVELADSNWRRNALSHELVHVLSHSLLGITGHCYWRELGILKMLHRLTGKADNTQPEAKCQIPLARDHDE